MQNTTAKLLFLLIVTGALFVGCAKDDDTATETDAGGSLEESVLGDFEGDSEDSNEGVEVEEEGGTSAPHETTNPDATTTPATDTPSSNGPTELPSDTTTQSSTYKDGTYNAIGTYQSPAGAESMSVTLVIKDDTVSSVSVSPKATNETSLQFQGLFAEGVSAVVVGKSLDSLGNLGAVNGSSLSPNGFSSALVTIKTLAKS